MRHISIANHYYTGLIISLLLSFCWSGCTPAERKIKDHLTFHVEDVSGVVTPILDSEATIQINPTPILAVGDIDKVSIGAEGSALMLTPSGRAKMVQATGANVGKKLAIALNGKVFWVSSILNPIDEPVFMVSDLNLKMLKRVGLYE